MSQNQKQKHAPRGSKTIDRLIPETMRGDRFALTKKGINDLLKTSTIDQTKHDELMEQNDVERKLERPRLNAVAHYINTNLFKAMGDGFKGRHFDVLTGISKGNGFYELKHADPAVQAVLNTAGPARAATCLMNDLVGESVLLAVVSFDDGEGKHADDEIRVSSSVPYCLPYDLKKAIEDGFFHGDFISKGGEIIRVPTLGAFTNMMGAQRGNLIFSKNPKAGKNSARYYIAYHGSGKVIFGHEELAIPADALKTKDNSGKPISVTLAEKFSFFVVVGISPTPFPDAPTEADWQAHMARATATVSSTAKVYDNGSFHLGGYDFEGKVVLGIRGSKLTTAQLEKAVEKLTPKDGEPLAKDHPTRKQAVFVLTNNTSARRSETQAQAFVDAHGHQLWELAIEAAGKIAVAETAVAIVDPPADPPADAGAAT